MADYFFDFVFNIDWSIGRSADRKIKSDWQIIRLLYRMRRKELRVLEKPIFVFTGVVIKENEGYSSLCLELDVASQGETIEEANLNLMEAVTLYLETAIESNLPLIRPVLERENPINTRPNDVMKIFKMNIDFQVRAYA